ncbi:murein biosynthesis integral membrane protein MurJ [Pseudomonas sp. NPDC087029]|uniref:murein biosynthesis integral membrane protein MurJ n=1 Tax=Pseudomonas sp. NPDC087029 TaxID=3364433 RepID=UPI003818EF49
MKVRLFSYALLAFLLILLGKLSGFFKDMLFTYYYGVSAVTDGYFLANSIASLLYIAVYSSIPVLVVPLYSRLLSANDRAQTDANLTRVLAFFLAISVVLGAGVTVGAQPLVELFAGAASREVKALAGDYLGIVALTFALSTVVAFLNALQTVHKRPLPSYIVPLVNNMMFCLGLVLFSASSGLTHILYLGVAAWLLLMVANAWTSRRYFTLNFAAFAEPLKGPGLLMLFVPAALSFYVEQVNSYVGVYFASQLGAGAISVLGYAGKLNLIFLSIFLVFLTATLFPKIAALVARDDGDGLDDYLNLCLRIIFLCALPVVLFMIFYAHPIVELLFMRGKFSEADVARVAAVLSVILLAVPFALVRDLLNRVFFSCGNTSRPFIISLASLLLNLAISLLAYRTFGLQGLAWAVVFATVLSFMLGAYFVKREAGIALLRPNLRSLCIALACLAFAFALLRVMDAYLSSLWLVLCIPFAGCYFAALYACRVRETKLLIGWARRKLGR